jgi:hypothetical protein
MAPLSRGRDHVFATSNELEVVFLANARQRASTRARAHTDARAASSKRLCPKNRQAKNARNGIAITNVLTSAKHTHGKAGAWRDDCAWAAPTSPSLQLGVTGAVGTSPVALDWYHVAEKLEALGRGQVHPPSKLDLEARSRSSISKLEVEVDSTDRRRHHCTAARYVAV